WTGLAVVVCSAGIGLAAQTSSQSAAKQITVTGCVQRGSSATPGATGTTGTTGTTSSSESAYILTNASMGAPSSSTSSSTPSAAGTSGSTYRLDADSSKLSAHVGHKVEVTGELERASSMSSSSTSTSSSSSSSSMSSTQPKLKVDTVRMIAS